MSLRTLAAAAVLSLSLAGCARFDPALPAPIRPTEIVQFRYQGAGSDEGVTEIQDYGRLYRGDERPRTPTVYRRHLTRAQMADLQHVLTALELPDVERRQRKPDLVPWTMWGICVPVTRGTQCGQLLVDEWRDIDGAPALFTLLQSYRRDARLHPEK